MRISCAIPVLLPGVAGLNGALHGREVPGVHEYLRKLGAAIPEGLTMRQASELTDRIKATKQEMASVVKVPMRAP
jgi:hypothetical protein